MNGAGSSTFYVTVPTGTMATTLDYQEVGMASLYDSDAAKVAKVPIQQDGTNNRVRMEYPATWPTGNVTVVGATVPWTWATSDTIRGWFRYEIQ